MNRLIHLLCLAVFCLLTPAALPGLTRADDNKLTVAFLDVGQGDSILIISPEGKVALIDTGPPMKGFVKLLKKQGVKSIDLVVATHHHADHIGNTAAVIRAFKPKVYLDPGSAHTSRTYQRVLQAVEEEKVQFVKPEEKERRIKLGSVLLRVFPQPPEDKGNENNNSIGIRLEYGDFVVLLTGDSEKKERAWWKKNADAGLYSKVTVLKLAHHGSRNGTDTAWLKAAKPERAVACCGKANRYGHPHEETLERLQKANMLLLRTDVHGTITFTTDGTKWEVNEEKEEPKEQRCFVPWRFRWQADRAFWLAKAG